MDPRICLLDEKEDVYEMIGNIDPVTCELDLISYIGEDDDT